MSAVPIQLFSLGGAADFFTIHFGMRDQQMFRRALIVGQSFVVSNHVVAAIIYAKVGDYIASLKLGYAMPRNKEVAFGIAVPGLPYACFFQAHLAGKDNIVRVLRGTRHLQKGSLIHRTI